MNRNLVVIVALALIAIVVISCVPAGDNPPSPAPGQPTAVVFPTPIVVPTVVPATPVPSAPTVTPVPAPAPQPNPTQVPAPKPASNPTPIANPTPQPGNGTSQCDPLATTSLPTRADAQVNGISVRLQVRDVNQCFRPLFYNETGVNQGSNYKLSLPAGWTAISASVTAEVQREGSQAQQFKDTPVVVVRGPFNGGIGLFEGAIRIVPDEWTDQLLQREVVPIQRLQTKKPNLSPTEFR